MDSSWKFLIATLLFIVVVFGVFFFQAKTNAEDYEQYRYNGFEFRQAPNGNDLIWVTRIEVRGQPYNIPFYYHPSAVEDIAYTEGIASQITDNEPRPEVVYISLDPEGGSRPVIAAVEISRILGTKYNVFNMDVRSALSRPDPNVVTDVRTCEDAVNGTLVVVFEQGPVNAISHAGNCVLLTYTEAEESIRVADRFAYELLKIM